MYCVKLYSMKDYAGQLSKTLVDKKNILIVLPKNPSSDTIASSIALFDFLQTEKHCQIEIISQDFTKKEKIKFLKKQDIIKDKISNLKKFILSINIKDTGLKEMSYDIKDDKLKIYITPKQNHIKKENIKTAESDFRYDLIFVLGAHDLNSLGEIYENNTELFYKKTIINIDNNPHNEHFGHINIVDVTKSSVSELLFEILENWHKENINPDIANAILTGMITSTKSFKESNTKPQTLELASRLMHLGANRDYIIENLYRTRKLNTLKLWGTVLSHLKNHKEIGLVSSKITRNDFIKSNTDEADLSDIVEEIISTNQQNKMSLLVFEQREGGNIKAILQTEKIYDAKKLLFPFAPSGDNMRATAIFKNSNLTEVEEKIVNHITKNI